MRRRGGSSTTQVVEDTSDIVRYNTNKSATVGFGMISDTSGLNSSVTIASRYDPNVSSYNPGSVDIKAPELILQGGIENRGGVVTIDNLHGSIFNNASINASEISLTSGGSFFVNDKTPGIYNIGPHPSSAVASSIRHPMPASIPSGLRIMMLAVVPAMPFILM